MGISTPVTGVLQEERDGDVAVVLIHGFGAGCFAWRLIMPHLAQKLGCRVYAFDRPGFGAVPLHLLCYSPCVATT